LNAGGLASIAKSDDAESTPLLALDGIFHGIVGTWNCKILIFNEFFLQNTIEWE